MSATTPKRRKAYDSNVPTLFWHKRRERWYILWIHPGTRQRQWKKTGVAHRNPDGTPPPEAEAKLAEHVKLLGAESLGLVELSTTEQTRTTVNQCLDLWADEQRREEKGGARSSLQQLALLRKVFGQVRVSALTLKTLNDARDRWRAEGFAKATINLRIGFVRRACKIGAAHKLILKSPTFPSLSGNGKGDGWPMYDCSDNVREGLVSPEDLARVNAAEPEPVVRDFNTFAFWTGMRFGSIAGLTWDGFNPRTFALRLHPRSSKNRKGLVYRLPPGSQLQALIARRWANRLPTDRFIFAANGFVLEQRWALAWRRAGLPLEPAPRSKRPGAMVPKHIFHDLRRTGLTNLINSGVTPKVAMMISGHKTLSVFNRYTILGEAEVEQALAAVDTKIGAVPELVPLALSRQGQSWARRRAARAVTPGRVVRLSAHTRPVPAATPARIAHVGS